MAVPTISPRQQGAVSANAAGSCAPCGARQRATLPPGVYVLRMFEFNNYEAARDARQRASALTTQKYRPVDAASSVYLFRQQGDEIKLEATLRGAATHTVTVKHTDGAVALYACISRFPLPPQRLKQLLGPNGAAVVERRCVVVSPSNTANVRAAGGQTYDVVMPDYRRISLDLHAVESARLNDIAAYAEDPKIAQRRMLAELTLQTAKNYEKQDPKVWSWLERVPTPGPGPGRAPRARAVGLTSQPWTTCEVELIRIYQQARVRQQRAEIAAEAKYAWMAEPGYREMRWDSLTDPALLDDTVKAEGKLFAPALETTRGRNYARDYAVPAGTWYDHYLQNMNAAARQSVRSNPVIADAYWALLGVVGTAMMEYAAKRPELGEVEYPSADKTSQSNDVRKAAGGVVDAAVKGPHSQRYDKATDKALEHYRDTRADAATARQAASDVRAREASAAVAEQRTAAAAHAAADEATAAANAPRWVIERWAIRSIRETLGTAPRSAVYDPVSGLFVPTNRDFTGTVPVLTTEGAVNPLARQRAADAQAQAARVDQRLQQRAAQAQQRIAQATSAEGHAVAQIEPARLAFIEAHGFEVANRGKPWATTGMVASLQLLNLGLAVKTLIQKPTGENATKLGGAVADLIYGFEFGFAKIVANGEATAATAGGVASKSIMNTLLAGTRVAGVVGGGLSFFFSTRDAVTAFERHDVALGWANAAGAVGAAMLTVTTLGAMGAFGAGTVATLVAATSWTVFGALLILAAAAAIWYFSKPPMEDWFLHCPWGTRAAGASTTKQLTDLLQLLCTPGFSARQLAAADSPWRRPSVCVTLRPPLFFAGQSSMIVHADANEHGRYLIIDHFAAGRMTNPVQIGPLDEHFLRRLTARRESLRLVGPGSGAPISVSAFKDEKGLGFEVTFPVPKMMDGRGGPGHGDEAYKATGTAQLTLWRAGAGKDWEAIHLDSMDLGPALIANTHSSPDLWR